MTNRPNTVEQKRADTRKAIILDMQSILMQIVIYLITEGFKDN